MCQNTSSEDMTVPDENSPESPGNENTESPEKQEQPGSADAKPVPGAFTAFGQSGRQDVISPTTMVTPAGLFNVFDPGTAPENVFVSKRQPGYPLKPSELPSPSQSAAPPTTNSNPAPVPGSGQKDVGDTRNLYHPPNADVQSAAAKKDALRNTPNAPMMSPGTASLPPRSRENPESDTVGIAILCVLFFVVSCAATVILGPRIVSLFANAFHLQ